MSELRSCFNVLVMIHVGYLPEMPAQLDCLDHVC